MTQHEIGETSTQQRVDSSGSQQPYDTQAEPTGRNQNSNYDVQIQESDDIVTTQRQREILSTGNAIPEVTGGLTNLLLSGEEENHQQEDYSNDHSPVEEEPEGTLILNLEEEVEAERQQEPTETAIGNWRINIENFIRTEPSVENLFNTDLDQQIANLQAELGFLEEDRQLQPIPLQIVPPEAEELHPNVN
ncbi:zinc finger protein [Corchorus olitorius]|uniref:Zinc finger protein n=1 Tax=Corchorus olitorius TaxID=93759 RepID=A0A1R3GR21_9ROSI|nr:zinc finger protein [Corchorus olitorius]